MRHYIEIKLDVVVESTIEKDDGRARTILVHKVFLEKSNQKIDITNVLSCGDMNYLVERVWDTLEDVV